MAGLPEEGSDEVIREALANLLGIDVSMIKLPETSRRHHRRSDARRIQFEIVGDSKFIEANADSLVADLKSGNLTAKLSSQLSQEYNMTIGVTISNNGVAEDSVQRPEGEDWEEVGGEYILRRCPLGYLKINTTVTLSTCKECEDGTYSLNFEDGCNAVTCDTRDCTACPAGADCSRGSEPANKHFRPKAIRIGHRVHPISIVIMSRQQQAYFFCDDLSPYCSALDLSLPKHAAALAGGSGEEYLWEYVEQCGKESQPCSEEHQPSILLRRCPAGSVLVNKTQSGRFDPTIQECLPCGEGWYVVDPMRSSCQKCPDGADCPDGDQFVPRIKESEWTIEKENDNLIRRVTRCPPGYALERKDSNPQSDRCELCRGPGYYSLEEVRSSLHCSP